MRHSPRSSARSTTARRRLAPVTVSSPASRSGSLYNPIPIEIIGISFLTDASWCPGIPQPRRRPTTVPSRAEPARSQTPDATGGGTSGGAPGGTGIAAPGGAGTTRRAGRQLPAWLVAGIPAVAALVVGGYRLGGA